jgi:hypothetical protein
MSCGHQWRKFNDVEVCVRCGLTRTYDGKILFDRRLPNVKPPRTPKKGVKKVADKNPALSRLHGRNPGDPGNGDHS